MNCEDKGNGVIGPRSGHGQRRSRIVCNEMTYMPTILGLK